jgi:hypothetical protein
VLLTDFSLRFTRQFNMICIEFEPIKNGIREVGIRDAHMPGRDLELRDQHGGHQIVVIIQNVQQELGFDKGGCVPQPVIQEQQSGLVQGFNHRVSPFQLGDPNVLKEAGKAEIAGDEALFASRPSLR